MIRLLLAALAALSPATLLLPVPMPDLAAAPATDAGASAAFGWGQGMRSADFDDGLLPGPTGWFLVPVTVAETAALQLDLEIRSEDADATPSLTGLVHGTADRLQMEVVDGWTGGPLKPVAEVNRDGTTVSCCAQAGLSAMSSGTKGTLSFDLAAGETFWLGLLAADWEPGSEAAFSLRSDVPFTVGALHQGRDVRAVDLVEEARRAGDNVRTGDVQMGSSGVGAASFEPRGTGLVVVDYWAQGEARGRVKVTKGPETLVDTRMGDGDFGRLAAATGGAVGVVLSDLDIPNRLPSDALTDPGRFDHVAVRVLFADVDVPFDALQQWEGNMYG